MNSKIGNYTEDELAYDFFESLTKLFKSINTTKEEVEKASENINTDIFYREVRRLDTSIPNIGITLNNKLVELYQEYKEKGIQVFDIDQEMDDLPGIRILPTITFTYLINITSEVSQTELEGFLNKYKELEAKKAEKINGIEKSKISFIRRFSEKIWEFRARLNPDVIYELYYSEEEVEELRDYIEFYKEFDNNLNDYNLYENISDSIIKFFEVSGYTQEQIEDLLENNIEPDLEKLGLKHQMKYIRERLKENIQEEHLKSWELTDSEKRRIQEETASITTKVSTQTKTKARTENIRM